MCFLSKASSILVARIISLIFRDHFFSFVRRKFRATCCVIVEAPCAFFPCAAFRRIARTMPPASTPGCVQKFASSAARNASVTCGGISSSGIT